MRWKEFGLWLAFLIFCFGSGYLHGHLPDFRLQFFFLEPEKVRIVVFEKALFPSEIIKELEDQTNTEIILDEVKTWEEARLKTVLNPGAHLLFLPSHWIPPLSREGRLRTVTSLKRRLEKEIATELRRLNVEKIYEVPLFWTIFEFAIPETFKNELTIQLFENVKVKNILTYRDPEMTKLRLKNNPWDYPKIKAKLKHTPLISHRPRSLQNSEIIEVPLQIKKDMKSVVFSTLGEKSPLYVYSLAIPNNTPQRATSFALIQSLISSERFDEPYSHLPVGSALNRMDKKLLDRAQRASYLKEISFKDLQILDIGSQ